MSRRLVVSMMAVAVTWTAPLVAPVSWADAHANTPVCCDRADSPPVLGLSVRETAEVQPDRMRVVMAAEASGQDLGSLNRQVLTSANAAVDLAKASGVAGLEVSLSSVSSQALVDDRGRPTGWRVRADLRLVAGDFKALGELSARLAAPSGQSLPLVFRSVGFELSEGLRNKTLAGLRTRVSQQFRQRASEMARDLGYREAQPARLQLSEDGGGRPMVSLRSFESRAMPMAAAAAPGLPGLADTIEVGVELSGEVRLIAGR